MRGSDSTICWLEIRGRKAILSRLPLTIITALFADNTHCPVPCYRWATICGILLAAILYSKCPGMPQIKRKPPLVISSPPIPGLCWRAVSPALKSRPPGMCLKSCCRQTSPSLLNPWAASNYDLYKRSSLCRAARRETIQKTQITGGVTNTNLYEQHTCGDGELFKIINHSLTRLWLQTSVSRTSGNNSNNILH